MRNMVYEEDNEIKDNMIHLAKADQKAIKYVIKKGGKDSIVIVKNVDEHIAKNGRPYPSYGGICKAREFTRSNKKLIFSEHICVDLIKAYKYSLKERMLFLRGYQKDNVIFLDEAKYPPTYSTKESVNLRNYEDFVDFYWETQGKYSSLGQPAFFILHNHLESDSPHVDKEKILNNLSLKDCRTTQVLVNRLNLPQYIFTKFRKPCFVGTIMINRHGDINAIYTDNEIKTIDKIYYKAVQKEHKSADGIEDISTFTYYDEKPLGVFRNYKKNYDLQKLPEQEKVLDAVSKKHFWNIKEEFEI